MSFPLWNKKIITLLIAILVCGISVAGEGLYNQARTFQREGKYDDAIVAFKNYLKQPVDAKSLDGEQLFLYTEALVQLMNTYQSKGEPEACITALKEVYDASPILHEQCQRDYYAVLGYALSRTEDMKAAEGMTRKALTLPLYQATPERYFRDYAYAAAVFYSNPDYQDEVIDWCKQAMIQAESCQNTSGKQWVAAMLGAVYKRNGHFSDALELFLQSKDEAQQRNDDLGVLNSLLALSDLLLYCSVPEYADIYASEAVRIEKTMVNKNAMVSAQTYICKGRALLQLGQTDSVSIYAQQARDFCQFLPYNSGLVDVELLNGIYLTTLGGDSLNAGIQQLQRVADDGTAINRARAYHQLALTYLKNDQITVAEAMLDSMYVLLNQGEMPMYIRMDYEEILSHYLRTHNHEKAEQYAQMMLQEQHGFKEKKLNYNLVEAIVSMKTAHEKQELNIAQLKQTNQRLWFLISVAILVIVIVVIVACFLYQKKRHVVQINQANERLTSLAQDLTEIKNEKEIRAQEIKEILNKKDHRQELETLTPAMLHTDGESKFRQCFELLYPLFLPRLREKVPSVTHREELLSMLIVLKQDNKRIAELLAIAPRSVLMLRHRFRQKIGMTTEYSLENFIEDILAPQGTAESVSETKDETAE